MSITPVILGKGRSGQAMAKSLAILGLLRPELEILPPVWLDRGASLDAERERHPRPILCISNPHGLHAETILQAERAGYFAILCEKPACVNPAQLERLREIKTPTAVMHVYRQTWGMQSLKQLIGEGQLGEVITIEGRYWQASTAERALTKSSPSWKNDLQLSGEFDTYLDTGTHWVDAVSFLFGCPPVRIQGWRSFANADAPHRDSHIQLALQYPAAGRAFGSISKTCHGADNHFEVNVLGSKSSATWEFLKPDHLVIGKGRSLQTLARQDCNFGTRQPPFHGAGWLEGYVEIASQLLSATLSGGDRHHYPSLQDNLDLLDSMFRAEWAD